MAASAESKRLEQPAKELKSEASEISLSSRLSASRHADSSGCEECKSRYEEHTFVKASKATQVCETILFQYARHYKHLQGWTCFPMSISRQKCEAVRSYSVTHIDKYVFTHVKHNDESWKVITRLALVQKNYTTNMM